MFFLKRHRTRTPNKRLIDLREKKGLTQEQLAVLVDLSQSMIAKIESGDRDPSTAVKIRLAKFFNVGIEWLFYGQINDLESCQYSTELCPTGTDV